MKIEEILRIHQMVDSKDEEMQNLGASIMGYNIGGNDPPCKKDCLEYYYKKTC